LGKNALVVCIVNAGEQVERRIGFVFFMIILESQESAGSYRTPETVSGVTVYQKLRIEGNGFTSRGFSVLAYTAHVVPLCPPTVAMSVVACVAQKDLAHEVHTGMCIQFFVPSANKRQHT
jgi:hypothetical protein